MIYYSDAFLDSLLLEDIHYGDLTTRALGIGAQSGEMHFSRKQAGYVSGLTLGQKLLEKLGLQTQLHANDGDHTEAGALLLTATGRAEALHQGWKIVQNVIEWSSGVTQMTRCMVDTLRQYQPDAQLACTRKNIHRYQAAGNRCCTGRERHYSPSGLRGNYSAVCQSPPFPGRAGKLVCSDCNIAP